jgi:hypothetical protein
MNGTGWFWVFMPSEVRLLILCMAATALLSAIRLLRIGVRISFQRGGTALRKRIESGEITADNLARFALSNRAARASQEWFRKAEALNGRPAAQRVLRETESRFLYFCDMCYAALKSARRASVLILLVSLFTMTYGAWPSYFYNCALSDNSPANQCLIRSIASLLEATAFGLSLSIVLYALAGFIASKLDRRIAEWNYFFRCRKDCEAEIP